MKRLLTHIRALLGALLAERPAADPVTTLCPRGWADLPIYHPPCDPDPKARCQTSALPK